ncbi:MAG: hypothetical protein SGI98_00590 [Verrucomicrobiota bacterium]|nr:hypothetical protein [Verrucomicrobiota bacterium]
MLTVVTMNGTILAAEWHRKEAAPGFVGGFKPRCSSVCTCWLDSLMIFASVAG